MSDRDLLQAFLVADEVLAAHAGKFRSSLLGLEILTDTRMPPGCWALGSREGCIVVCDLDELNRLRGVAGGTGERA